MTKGNGLWGFVVCFATAPSVENGGAALSPPSLGGAWRLGVGNKSTKQTTNTSKCTDVSVGNSHGLRF